MDILRLKKLAGADVPTFYKAVINKTAIGSKVKTLTQSQWEKIEETYKGVIGKKKHILTIDSTTKQYVISPVLVEGLDQPEECTDACSLEEGVADSKKIINSVSSNKSAPAAIVVASASCGDKKNKVCLSTYLKTAGAVDHKDDDNDSDDSEGDSSEGEVAPTVASADTADAGTTSAGAVSIDAGAGDGGGGGVSESVEDKHKTKIAKQTLKMSDVGARVMGGMTKEAAREHLKKAGHSDDDLKKMEESVDEDIDAILEKWNTEEVEVAPVENTEETVDQVVERLLAADPLIVENHSYEPGRVVYLPKEKRHVKILKHGPMSFNAISRKAQPTYVVAFTNNPSEQFKVSEDQLMPHTLESYDAAVTVIKQVDSGNHPHDAHSGVVTPEPTDTKSPVVKTEDDDSMKGNVDDTEDKNERTGIEAARSNKVEIPASITKQINDRISELKQSIEDFDRKGYNDHSLKQKAIDCLEQIKLNLASGDEEGLQQAQVFYTTLMSPIWDLLPSVLAVFLATADNERLGGMEPEVK